MFRNRIFFTFAFILLMTPIANAQHVFVRVYNTHNQKFQKGYLQHTSDSGIVLIRNGSESGEIKYTDIYKIRMRRSAGLTTLVAGGIPVVAGSALIVRNNNWDNLTGLVLFIEGLIIGPVAGGIKAVLNPKPMIIGGNYQSWMKYKQVLDQKLAH
ncbi:MAG: hypothetical protein FJY19_07320 [Bacteroidetes bacterium]|nr:hypothetical protein [Bacteroidota bacterium]